MMFPRACVGARPLLGMLSATALAAACIGVSSAAADDDPAASTAAQRPLHGVGRAAVQRGDLLRRHRPAELGGLSHDPYQFSPKVDADVGPNQQWNLDVGLANPDEWAKVVASTGGESTKSPNIHCALAVDGVVVKTHQGPKGALCSLRNW